MVQEILQWSLPCHNGLNKESKHGEHGQPSILDLLHLQLSKCNRVIGQPQWVKVLTTRVQIIPPPNSWKPIDTITLNQTHQENLEAQNSQNALGMDQVGVPEVVQSTLGEDLGSGLEPDGLFEVNFHPFFEHFGGYAPECTEHCPSAVDHFKGPVTSKSLGVGREPSSVPAIVAGKFTGEVGWGLGREGAQVLDSVGTVPELVPLVVDSDKTMTCYIVTY